MNDEFYIRWKSEVSGPFLPEVVKIMLLEGRVTKHHQVSSDRVIWTPLHESEYFRAECRVRPASNPNSLSSSLSHAVLQPEKLAKTNQEQSVDEQKLRVKPTDTDSAQDRWFYLEEGQATGPVTMRGLRGLIGTGTIQKQTQICKEGDEQWVKAGKAFPSFWQAVPPPLPLSQQNPEICPLCEKSKHMKKGKPLYGLLVCRNCYYSFANRRQLAFLFDNLFFSCIILMLVWGIQGVSNSSQGDIEGVVNVLGFIFFPVFCLKDGFSGRSLGKAICGVQVIDETTGEPCNFLASFKRNLPIWIPIMGLVVACQLCKGHRTGDKWSNTKVIWRKFATHPIFAPTLARD
jgi:uncharacterized RDD family membrane protein YckC